MADRHLQLHDLPAATLRALVREHLTSKNLLQLFRSSRPLAHVVAQHATGMHATLAAQPFSQLGQSLLQACEHVHLVLVRNSLCHLNSVQHRENVKQLTLQRFNFSPETLQGLQLQTFNHLQSLHVQDCSCWLTPVTLNELVALQVPSSLTQLRVSGLATSGVSQLWGQLLGEQIQELQCGHLTTMQMLRWFPSISHFQLDGTLTDEVLGQLLTKTTLQHVTADWLVVERQQHSSKDCHWQTLTLKCGVSLMSLRNLPLQGIQQLRIHALISCRQCSNEVMCQTMKWLQESTQVECIPSTGDAHHRKMLPPLSAPPAAAWTFTFVGKCLPSLVHFCCQRIAAGPASLHLYDLDLTADLLPVFAVLPAALTVVVINSCQVQDAAGAAAGAGEFEQQGAQLVRGEQPATAGTATFWQQFVAVLPQHITHIILLQSSCGYATQLQAALADGKHGPQMIVRA